MKKELEEVLDGIEQIWVRDPSLIEEADIVLEYGEKEYFQIEQNKTFLKNWLLNKGLQIKEENILYRHYKEEYSIEKYTIHLKRLEL